MEPMANASPVIGDSQAAIDLALEATGRAKSVSLIHSAPLRAEGRRKVDLTRAAAARRLIVLQGDLASVQAAEGRLARIEVAVNGTTEAHDVDLLLVKAGLEYVTEAITGLPAIAPSPIRRRERPRRRGSSLLATPCHQPAARPSSQLVFQKLCAQPTPPADGSRPQRPPPCPIPHHRLYCTPV